MVECRAVRAFDNPIIYHFRKMVKGDCFQATARHAHVVVVVGPSCLCSVPSSLGGMTLLFDLQNKAYGLSVLW